MKRFWGHFKTTQAVSKPNYKVLTISFLCSPVYRNLPIFIRTLALYYCYYCYYSCCYYYSPSSPSLSIILHQINHFHYWKRNRSQKIGNSAEVINSICYRNYQQYSTFLIKFDKLKTDSHILSSENKTKLIVLIII